MPTEYASQQLQSRVRSGMEPLWSDYLKTVGIGSTDVLAAIPAGTRYAAELTDTDIGESIASSSQYLQDVVHGWGEDLEAGLSEPAKERLLAEFGSEEFWNHPGSSIALKAARTVPSMAATVGATMFTAGGAPAAAMLAGVSGGLSATQTVDEMYRTVDTMSDADLRTNSKLYNQFRQDGLSEREARRELNQVNIGAKPAILMAVGAATSLFGPEAQIARTLGKKGLGQAFEGGILRRTGKAMGAGAVSEAIETGAETIASEQGAVDVGFQPSINPYRVLSATAEGTTLGGLFGVVGGVRSTRPPVRPTTNANTRAEPDNPAAAEIKPIVAPAPGPVSMPGKGSNTDASPPIVAGRVGYTAPTSRIATVPGAKGDAFKKSKGAKGKSNVIPLVQPAPATGTAATAPIVTAPIAPPAPQGDPGGLVADQTQVAALTASKAPTGLPGAPSTPQGGVAPTPTPAQAVPTAPRTTSQVQRDQGVGYVEAANIAEQERAATAPAPTPVQTAPSPASQVPGAGFGAGTVAAPVTQAVSTEGATPSAFGGVAQPVAAPQVAPSAPVAEAIPTAPVITAPEVAPPVAPVTTTITPAKIAPTGDKNAKRTAARTRDAQIAQDFLNGRPAEPVVPTTLPEVDEFVSGLKDTLEQVKALDVKFRTRVSGEKMPASLVWLRELETAYNKLKTGKLGFKATNKVISEFITREIQLKSGDVAEVKATRKGEGGTAKAVPQGNVETIAASPSQAATEEEAARRESEEVSLEEGVSEKTVAGEEAEPDVGVSEEVTETVSKEGEVSHEKAEIGEVIEKPKPGQVSKDDVETKVSGSKAGRVKLGEDLVEREITLASGEKVKEQVPKAVTREVSAEARAEIMARYAGAKAEPKPEPEKLPSEVAPKVEAIKAKAAEKKAAQKARKKKLVTKEVPKPSGKAALAEELEKIELEPTDGQIAADNATKAHTRIGGLPISLTVAPNTERTILTETGRRVNWLYKYAYGHILGTKAPDGKPIDVFLGPEAYPNNPKLKDLPVVIIDQVDPDTKAPDEPKVMFGFKQVSDPKLGTGAVEAYEGSYPRGKERRGDVTIMSLDEFKTWLKTKSDAEPAGVPVSDVDVAVAEAADTIFPATEIARGMGAPGAPPLTVFGGTFTTEQDRAEAYITFSERMEENIAKTASQIGRLADYMQEGMNTVRSNLWISPANRALYPQFAKRIRAIAADVKVYIVPDPEFMLIPGIGSQDTQAIYNLGKDFIVIRESIADDDIEMAQVILHEAVHAAFMKAVYQSPKAIKTLQQILDEAVAGVNLSTQLGQYGFTNIDELVAEAMSNITFQEYLAGVKASPDLVKQLGLTGKIRSLWDVLVRLMGRTFGLGPVHDTLLGAVIKVSARLEHASIDAQGRGATNYEVRNWVGHKEDTFNPLTPFTHTAFRIPERINERLPSQVRQAPQQQQQGSPWLMAIRTMDQIVQASKGFGTNFYEHLRKVADTTERIRTTADKYLEESLPLIRESHDLENKYKGTGLWERAVNLEMAETRLQVYSDRDLASQVKLLGKNTLRGALPKAEWAALNAEYQALKAAAPDLMEFRTKALDFYKDQQNLERIGIIRNSLKISGFDDPNLAQRLFDGDETDADIAALGRTYDHIKDASELAKLKGPYFPQMRRGEYIVRALAKIVAPTNALRALPDENGEIRTWEFAGKGARKRAMDYAASQKGTGMTATPVSVWVDKNTGERYFNLGQPDEVRVRPEDADAEQRFRVTVQNRYVDFFESKREALRAAAELRQDPAIDPGSIKPVVEKKYNPGDRQADVMSHQLSVLASSLERRPGYQNLSPNEQNQVVQAFNTASLRLLSSTRIQTKRMQRTNVLGASRDFTRNMLEYAKSVAGYLARLDHQDTLNTAMKAARAEADSSNDYNKTLGQSQIMNRMEKLVAESTAFDPTGKLHDIGNWVLAVNFGAKLISPAYNSLNALQVPMITYPALASTFGPGRAAMELQRTYRELGVGQILKQGLVASKRALMQGPDAEFPSIIEDLISRVKSPQVRAMLRHMIEVGSIDGNAGVEIPTMIESRTGVAGIIDRVVNYIGTFGRQMPKSVEVINRAVTAIAAYNLQMKRSGNHDASVRFAQETVNMTQGLYSHSNAAPIFNHPLGRMSFQFKKYPQLVYGMIGQNVGKAIRNAEPGDRAEAVKTLAYMAATHVVMAGALGLPTEPLKWLIIGARQAGITELTWADVENNIRELLASGLGSQLGEIAARGITRALPEGFAFDLSSRVGMSDLMTFGEPRSADQQDLKSFLWDVVAGAPAGLVGDWFRGSQALMNGEFGEAAQRFSPVKMLTDAIKSYRQTSEGKRTAAGYVSLSPYGIGEVAIRTLGFTPAREAETSEARNYYYGATKRASATRNALMQDWYQASSSQRGRLWGQIEAFNRGKTSDEKLTRSELDKYAKRRRTEERSGLVQSGFRVTRREKNQYKKLQNTYSYSP